MEAAPKVSIVNTEIGPFPDDWQVVRLDSIGRVKGGKRLPLGKSLTDKIGEHPYIRVSDMRGGSVDQSKLLYVPDEIFPLIRNYTISCDDLFISVAGTLGLIGRVPPGLSGANLTENADKITDLHCDRDYLYYCLSSQRIQLEIDAKRTIGAQPKLAIQQIEAFRIPLPPSIEEQKHIARTLTDIDDLIASLDAVIAKKRDIKQAAMQQLLTGKMRLPRFKGEWPERKLGTEIKMQVGFPFASRFFNRGGQGTKLVRNRDLHGTPDDTYYAGPFDDDYLITNGDVLVGMDGDFRPCLWA
ncbi:restriction endonuclease subunit S, partial [Gluconobacter oxydans]|uniref:restriction endonuclease subunit S n=1 Tax=Gluconobacter oxydans TaxID=442 RepID=UPI0039E76E26